MKATQFEFLVRATLGGLIDPRLCPACGASLAGREIFCPGCRERLLPVTNPCRLCGLENRTRDDTCAACLYDPPRWQHMVAPLIYRGMTRDLLMRFKFSGALWIADSLLRSLVGYYAARPAVPAVLIPVPLHRNRLLERGFNQAAEIARWLSIRLDIPVDEHAMTRVKPTVAQSGLSANQREKNILKAFQYRDHGSYRHVAVIDDVVTTGSTANEITRTLHRGGVEIVEIWSIARVLK